jgi:hypothetical protein
MSYNIHKAYLGTESWVKVEPHDPRRKGWILQNHTANSGAVLVSGNEPTDDFAAIELWAGGSLVEDVLGSTDALWIKSASGSTLTVVLKY